MTSRRSFLKNVLGLAACLSLPFRWLRALPLAGTTYYIDTAGDNQNSGTSAAEAWKDFTNVNKKTFQPGDSVLLKRGCIWNQERLTLNGSGSLGRFIVVGSYGTGNRPKIQQSGNQSDRCMRLNNPSFVKVSGIEVCSGGVGILLYYDRSYNNRCVYLDDIVAHDFQSTGVAREDPHDRVSWAYGIGVTGVDNPANDQDRVLSDFRITNTEVYNTGAGIALDWANHHTIDGKMALRNKFGDVYMENLRLHDNTVEGIAFVSLFLTSVTNCTIKNSVINKGARFAPTGSSAVQVMYSKGVILENVTISNTLHNECPDNSALDFECDNEDAVVDGCTFENNAGPAIEFLATPDNPNPYTRNFAIRNCTFINNNWAKKLSNSQIVVPDWDKGNTPSGRIYNNRYQNAPGTTFFGGSGNTSQIRLTGNKEIS
jgi:Right handed beta helix region